MNNSSSSLGPHFQHFKARATPAGKVPQKLLLVKRREMYRYTARGRGIIVYLDFAVASLLVILDSRGVSMEQNQREKERDRDRLSRLLSSSEILQNVWTKCASDSDFVNELLQRQMMMIRSVAICGPKIRTWRSFATLCSGQ